MSRATAIPSDDVDPTPELQRRVTGFFDGTEQLTDAVQRLVEAGFASEGIDVVVIDADHGMEQVQIEQKTRVLEGAVAGTAAGVAVGLTLVTAFPGFALLVGGPVLAALQAGATGTIGGALNGLGWWRSEAQLSAEDLRAGTALIGLGVPVAREDAAVEALRGSGATRIDVT